MKRLQISSAGR